MELASDIREIDIDKVRDISDKGSHEWRVYAAAQMYVRSGFRVIPIRKNSKFLPAKEHKVSYQNASNAMAMVDKWFNLEDGLFRGWNIGIATGKKDGTFVIDVDRHGKEDGIEILSALEEEFGVLPPCPVQDTPSGGKHYIFHWQENATSSTGKIGASIDSRGGTETVCKGHIVVWPSVIDGKEYQWHMGGNRGSIPKWVMEKMGVPWAARDKRGSGRGNEYVGDNDTETKVELAQLEKMLGEIDPNGMEYDEWLRVGMAIKSQYPGEDGFSTWDKWSSQGERYEHNECHIRWGGLDELGAVRMGTLFYLAKESGWEPEKGDRHSNPLKDIVHAMNEIYAVVVIGGKLKILREKKGEYDPIFGHYDLIEKEAFKGLLQPYKIEIINDKGKIAMVPKADIWLGDEERRVYPNGVECRPDGKARTGTYNTWNGFSVEPVAGSCEKFLDHVKNIVCSGDEDHYAWTLDWCAKAVQEPGELPGTCIVMKGDEGTGKGILANTIGEFFGPHYRHLIDDAHLLSNFNAHMMDACFVFADEITYGGNVKTAGKLKGMVTETYLIGERKGIDAVGYRNMIHMMIASNDDWIIPVGPLSRRWFVLKVANSMANNKTYFDGIIAELNSGGREALLHFLLTRNITSNLNKAPRTKALDEQSSRTTNAFNSVIRWWTRKILEESLESADVKIIDMADVDGTTEWPKMVKTTDLLNEYSQWCILNKMNPVSDFTFYSDMRKLGFTPSRPSVNKARIRASKVPSIVDARAKMKKLGYPLPDEDEG